MQRLISTKINRTYTSRAFIQRVSPFNPLNFPLLGTLACHAAQQSKQLWRQTSAVYSNLELIVLLIEILLLAVSFETEKSDIEIAANNGSNGWFVDLMEKVVRFSQEIFKKLQVLNLAEELKFLIFF